MTIIAKVLDNRTAMDTDGNVVEIPGRVAIKALAEHSAIRWTGKQWRMIEMSVYDQLVKAAKPLAPVENHSSEAQNDVEEFLRNSISSKPENLIITPLKWKYLMRSVLRGKNIMMTGPSGCGKTLSAQSIAAALEGRPYFYFNMGATQDPRSTLIGNTHYNKDKGTFVADAFFVKAIQIPNAIILLDELTRAHADAWNILMSVLDENQRYLRIDEKPDTPTIRVASGVTFIATANIGAEYTATRVLDRAILDRFSSIVEMEPLGVEDEIALLKMTYPDVNDASIRAIAEIAAHTRQQVKSDDPKVTTMISSRVSKEMAGLLYDGFTLAETAESCVYPFFSPAGGADSERTYMKQLVQKYLPTSADNAGNIWKSARCVEEVV